MGDPEITGLETQLKKYKKLLNNTNYQNEIINEYIILSEDKCDDLTKDDIMEQFNKHSKSPIATHMNTLLNWKGGKPRKKIIAEFTTIQKKIKVLDKKISEDPGKPYDDSDIFNNKQRNINIQNKLIYIIRYKYNLFLSILFVIGLICIYKFYIPTLNK
jgi:hypothetical protein